MTIHQMIQPQSQLEALREKLLQRNTVLRSDDIDPWTAEEYLCQLIGRLGSLAVMVNAKRILKTHDAKSDPKFSATVASITTQTREVISGFYMELEIYLSRFGTSVENATSHRSLDQLIKLATVKGTAKPCSQLILEMQINLGRLAAVQKDDSEEKPNKPSREMIANLLMTQLAQIQMHEPFDVVAQIVWSFNMLSASTSGNIFMDADQIRNSRGVSH